MYCRSKELVCGSLVRGGMMCIALIRMANGMCFFRKRWCAAYHLSNTSHDIPVT